MESVLPWLSLGVCGLLSVACLFLYYDNRGLRTALRAAQGIVAALQKQVAGQGQRITFLERAVVSVAAGDPGGIKPTAQWQRPTVDALTRAAVQPSRSAASVDRQLAELGGAPPAPVELAGDREGMVPPPAPPSDATPNATKPGDSHRRLSSRPPPPVVVASESPEAIRARLEAEENERHPDDPPEELTQVFAGPRPPRPTLLGGLAGVPLERPTSSAKRTAEAFRKAHPLDTTLVSEGIRPAARETLTPTEPCAPTLDARIERLWHEKVAAAQADGLDVGHCHGRLCLARGDGIATCECRCDGCNELAALLFQAQREITGEDR